MPSDRHVSDEIRRQTSLESASAVLAEAAHGLGWDLAAYHVNIDAEDLPRNQRGGYIAEMMGWPTECLQGWRRFGLGRHCPIAALCGREADAFHWTCDERDTRWYGGELTVEQRQVMNHYGRYVGHGVAVPVRLASGGTGYVSWCSRECGDSSSLDASLGSVFFISYAFIRHAASLLEEQTCERAAGRLTVRERECLTWAARGKNEEEIASLIHRSRDTVHFHLRNAAVKLDAGNRTHAVAIACTRGLISLR
jgi:DNA-binding CsgD family transcriptional regulator